MRTSSSILKELLVLIGEGYSHQAWHGPNLRGSLRGVSAKEAIRRPAPGRHSVWEIAIHCAYWKYIVRRRILHEQRGSFPLKGSNWFPRPARLSEREWKDAIALLHRCHMRMVAAIRSLPPSALRKKPRGSKVSNAVILRGIASHDIYHAGQIQLVKRLIR